MTLKRLAAKITPKNAHLIPLSDEKSGTMLFKTLKTGFVKNKGQSGHCQLTVKPKADVSSRLNFRLIVSCQLKFWPFVSCQLTPSRPSYISGKVTKLGSQMVRMFSSSLSPLQQFFFPSM